MMLDNWTFKPRVVAWELLVAAVALASIIPIWAPQWLPLQDMPQHLAAIRVLSDYWDPALNFAEYYRVTPFKTQYLGYYAVVWVFSWIFEVGTANRIFLSACLVGTPYAMRYLLAALGRSENLVFFVFLLLYNTFLLLGFVNFLAAIPLMLLGLGLAAKLHRRFDWYRAVWLGVVGFFCFFMHVVPFAFLAVGTGLLGLKWSVWGTVKRWVPMLPAGIISILWTFLSPAGASTTQAVGESGSFRAARTAFEALPDWLTNIYLTPHDLRMLVAWVLILVVVVALGAGFRGRHASRPASWCPPVQRVGLLGPLALIGYFVLPVSYNWIWPIAPRFALIGLLLLIPALPIPKKVPQYVIVALLVAVSLNHYYWVHHHFQQFSQNEVGELQEAIDSIPKGERVAGLIFRRHSNHVRFAPFIHTVAYYQAQRGGAVMFTFADFPQSPFRFLEENRPPEVRSRWEWTPGRVNPKKDLKWYDYVLVRGGPGRISRQKQSYDKVFESQRWSVWERTRQ